MNVNLDLNAHHYQQSSQQQYGRARPLFQSENFSRDAKVLDVGCGDGKITAEIASLAPKSMVLGIDSSPNMIKLAKESFKLPNLNFQCVNAEDISIVDSFDKIFCFNCLLWIREPKNALDRLSKLLNHGATLTILTYLKESLFVEILEETLEEFIEYRQLSAVKTMLTLEEHRTILEANNMKLQLFEVKDSYYLYHNEDELIDYIKGWIRMYAPMPDHQQDMFLHKVVNNCFNSKLCQREGGINLPYRTLTIKAKKYINAE